MLALFGYAWVSFLDGDTGVAEETAFFLIGEDVDPIVRAHALYLLGHIHTHRGDYSKALAMFESAYSNYLKHGNGQQILNALLGISHAHIMSEELTEGEHYLEEAERRADRESLDKRKIHWLRIFIAEFRGDYDAAYEQSQNYADSLVTDLESSEVFYSLCLLAYFSHLAGCHEDGARYLAHAAILAHQSDFEAHKRFYHLCQILYSRCHGKPNFTLEDELRQWINTHQHRNLQRRLDFVSSWCG